MSRIVIFGLPYSPNLGDGVIADCLGDALRRARPGLEVVHIDISGRKGFGEVVVGNRAALLKLLARLPRPMRHALVRRRLGALLDSFAPAWADAARGADLAVIGGGQILSDADLNFPLKLSRVAQALRDTGRPAVIHAAGVARNWSAEGTRLFATLAACDLRAVGLRDQGSVAAWTAQMGGVGPAPRLTRDPGLLAAACYGPPTATPGGIGLCVTDPAILRYHADGGIRAPGPELFAGIATALARVAPVTLFCNGAAEDRAALDAVALATRDTPGIRRAAPPETPRALAHIVAGFDAVVAHRLHACILGYAYARPVVGLGWDAKLQSFFASVGLDDSFLPASRVTPGAVADATTAALERGIDADAHTAALDETRAHVALILNDLP